ncbi:unnamed protein product [Arabis nemorensis]|uniref:Uncharacterized protein n=1 Tax=Arabis nemorensis TaxID=586526 RepID=A0A565CCV1_9BRAS|nr:unnamed protein product [Arabis nemorensis]
MGEDARHRRNDRTSSAMEPALDRHNTGRDPASHRRAERTQVEREGHVEAVKVPTKMPFRQNLFGENASPAKPDSYGPEIRLESTQNWVRKESLSTGEEKRLGKRPVGGKVGEPSADAPVMQQAHEKRWCAPNRQKSEKESLAEEEKSFARAGWCKASVAEARAVNEASLWNKVNPTATATALVIAQKANCTAEVCVQGERDGPDLGLDGVISPLKEMVKAPKGIRQRIKPNSGKHDSPGKRPTNPL